MMSFLVFPHHEEVDDTQVCSAVFFQKLVLVRVCQRLSINYLIRLMPPWQLLTLGSTKIYRNFFHYAEHALMQH